MDQEKLVLLIAILLLINLFFTGWTFTRSMMHPLEKREGYGEQVSPHFYLRGPRSTTPARATTGGAIAR